ncbi:MAG: hypothetical protein ACF8PN_02800 [Phycisphaerales bacterium]
MLDSRTDEIAREAARLLETGTLTRLDEAINAAAERLRFEEAPRPSRKLVRDHARGIAMQALGAEGYRARIIEIWRSCENIMRPLEPWDPRLVGRAADGNIDAGVTLYFKVVTDERIGRIAEALCSVDFAEPEFETADTKFGRFDRIRFVEDGLEVVITRLPTARTNLARFNLHTGEPVTTLTALQLQAKIEKALAEPER